MTLDHETQSPIIPDPIKEVALQTLPAPIELENTDMMRKFGESFSNLIVNASHVAQEVKSLRAEMDVLRDALVVANEAARRAIEERDLAKSEVSEAKHREEMANKAYDTVNAQRIEAENSLNSIRGDLTEMERRFNETDASLSFKRSEVSRLGSLLDITRDERDALRVERDRVLLGNDELFACQAALVRECAGRKENQETLSTQLHDTRNDLEAVRLALNEALTAKTGIEMELLAEQERNATFNERIAILEKANVKVHEDNRALLSKVNSARQALESNIHWSKEENISF